jgi:2-iminoacetate synthase ThiH
MLPEEMERIILEVGRALRLRTTLYGTPKRQPSLS